MHHVALVTYVMTTGATLFVMMDLALLLRMFTDGSERLCPAMLFPW